MCLLVLTSTVYVNSSFTVLTDPEVRRQQYIESVLFYLGKPGISAIVICDNSGFDYGEVPEIIDHAALYKKKIETLSFKADSIRILHQGKGYGEGMIMNYVFDKSVLLREYSSFFKITGRVKVLNFTHIHHLIRPGNIYFEAIGNNPFKKQQLVDTRFYYCTREVFEKVLINQYVEVDDNAGRYLEHVYCDALTAYHVHHQPFGRVPVWEGVSGSTGQTLKADSRKKKALRCLNNLYRILYSNRKGQRYQYAK
ncbi:hypothetical protein [Chitinophaga silvisoli]|uniref:Glycosyltransferase family 2 protein n=1 Tax=Chitinophaga silvisoli TaxID=2291814 RepID=A0A3E1P6N2_9BACT|nr:hypothetical protein [Chitinophaga silvisoli]RFM35846.1 hypothetical protein DXN04_10800 [Chitinophaga silvisoli]